MASVAAGTGRPVLEASGVPVRPPPQPLSDEDLAKVKAALRARDYPRNSATRSPPPAIEGKGDGRGDGTSPLTPQVTGADAGPEGNSAPSKDVEDANGGDGGGIDQRLFAPVLRAILSGEGDHVLRRSLLCHPFLKVSKSDSSSAGISSGVAGGSAGVASSKGSGVGSTPSPLGTSRKKGSKAARGGKPKKRDRDKEKGGREQEDTGQGTEAAGSGAAVERSPQLPLDVSREMNRLAERASCDGSLQSTLILLKTLLCALDPAAQLMGTVESPSMKHPPSQQGGRSLGRKQISTPEGDNARAAHSSVTKIELGTAPLWALAGRGLSGWPEVMELLRREKYRERMMALRGRPSLTICYGKTDMRGRLEAKGESSGVVTAVQVRLFKQECFDNYLMSCAVANSVLPIG